MANFTVHNDEFTILNLSDVLNGKVPLLPMGAVYLFTREEKNGNHTILYVGKTENLFERDIPHHQQLACVYIHKGNSFCIHFDYDEDSRESKENSIIETYKPSCNYAPIDKNNLRVNPFAF